MLNADSSAEKSESELLHGVDDVHDRLDRPLREHVLEVRHERARRVGLVEEAEHGQQEEENRDEGHEREVRDHRGEVRAALVEELGECRADGMHESSGSLLVSLAVMDASAALAELVGLSTQVVEAVIVGTDGAVEAAHAAGEERAQVLAEAGESLLAAAAEVRPSAPPVERVHVDLERGSLVVVRDADRSIVATTVAEPTAGLVAFDLRAALRRLREASA